MIPPREQWCIQIEVTNACPRRCANCTRLLAHAREPFFMSVDQFAESVEAVRRFPTQSTPDRNGRRKCIGIMGGEPLLHPEFPRLVDLVVDAIPIENRGLWTGVADWQAHRFAGDVRRLLGDEPSASTKPTPGRGYLNHNPHTARVEHQPVLVAIADVVADRDDRDALIADCWLQRDWASAITPKGFFCCEVMAAFDEIFEGGGGMTVDDGCWRFDVEDYYFSQIAKWCPRCGVCLPLPGRRDSDNLDDVSRSNLQALQRLGSPRIAAGDFCLIETAAGPRPADWRPGQYIKGK